MSHGKEWLNLYLKFFLRVCLWLGLFLIIGGSIISVWMYLLLSIAFGSVGITDDLLYSLLIPLAVISLCAAKCGWGILDKFAKTKFNQ